jgi:hypothetical protein
VAEPENPYRASQQHLTNAAPAEHVWKEGPYLVVHATKSVLPNRCLFCDRAAAWRGRVVISRKINAPVVLGLIVFFPISLLFYSIRGKAKPLASLCSLHGQRHSIAKWSVYGPLGIAFTCLILLLATAVGILPYETERTYALLGGYLIGLVIWIIAGLASLAQKQLVTVSEQRGNYFWLSGIPASFFGEVPDISAALDQQR